jgi:prophage regulatory protein
MTNKILRLPALKERTGMPRSTIYLKIAQGKFPSPIKLGGERSVGWIEAEVDEWLSQQIEKRQVKNKAKLTGGLTK